MNQTYWKRNSIVHDNDQQKWMGWVRALIHFKKLPSLIPSHGLWEGIITTRIYDIKKMLKIMEIRHEKRRVLLNIWTNTYLALTKGY
jgi:hypothetical protein